MSAQFYTSTIEDAKTFARLAKGYKARIGYLVKRESFVVYLTPKPEKPRYRVVARTSWGKILRDRCFHTDAEVREFERHLERWGTSVCHWVVYLDGRFYRNGISQNTPGWQPTSNWTGD